jgi:3-isopropylmalate/(R)-2-methylmalate dehydratase small subunit
MEAFTRLTAVAAPLEVAKIDTGMILPGRYMRRHRRPGYDYAEAFLHDLRFDQNERPRPDFPLNQAAYRNARILITDADFGCGSSREGAAYAVLDFGLRALVGPSFGDIFFGNCMLNGVLPVVLPDTAIKELWEQVREQPGVKMTIDLNRQMVIAPKGNIYGFEVNAVRKERLLRGIDDIDFTMAYEQQIAAFEAARQQQFSWLPKAERES